MSGEVSVSARLVHQSSFTAMTIFAFWVLAAVVSIAHAQPSPEVQERISAAIKKAATSNSTDVDYTEFVNVFIGTDNYGDVW